MIFPCKVGDIVYTVDYSPCHRGQLTPGGSECFYCKGICDLKKIAVPFVIPDRDFIYDNFCSKSNSTYPKMYFLTRKEAQDEAKKWNEGQR